MGTKLRVCAVDVGTSGVKAGYFVAGKLRASTSVALKSRVRGSAVEMNPEDVLRAVGKTVRALCSEFGSPDCIAFDTFSTGLVLMDRAGRASSAIITHQDRRSVVEAREIVEEFGEDRVLKSVGNLPFPGGIGASTLRWLNKHEGAMLKRSRVGQTSTLVAGMLTPEFVVDPSQGAFLGLMKTDGSGWDEALGRFVGVGAGQLPRIVWADSVIGMVRREVANRLCVKAGTPVIGGFVDTSAAVMLTPMTPGQLVHNSGSTDVLALCVEGPRPSPHYLSRPVGVGAVMPARWLAASTIAAAGTAIEWVRATMFREMGLSDYYACVAKACKGEAGAVGFSSGLAGSRTAIEQTTAVIHGLTLSTTREDVLRGLCAGLMKESAERYEALAAVREIGETVYTMGKATALAAAMHRAWPKRHTFAAIKGDGLAGLNVLAERVMGV